MVKSFNLVASHIVFSRVLNILILQLIKEKYLSHLQMRRDKHTSGNKKIL